ncbi:MAG TPA: helix-turn-helix domain-containing protein [Symbiobacteriaceae bacterium]|nr:helix-turn-helix domain-containing protein [Symbiobacteriaceae bacterium]
MIPDTVGNRLRKAREAKGLTQLEAGRLLGISNANLSAYELDKREPDFETLKKLARLYACSTDYLLGRTDDPSGAGSVELTKQEYAAWQEQIRDLENEKSNLLRQLSRRDLSADERRPIHIRLDEIDHDLRNALGELGAASHDLSEAERERKRLQAARAKTPTDDLVVFLRGKQLTADDVEAVKDLLEARRLRREREESEKSQP